MVLIMKMKLAAAAVAACTLAACGSAAPSNTDASSGAAGKAPNVVVAFYPLQWASDQVLGSVGTASTLTAPGVEPHDLELTPRQVASLTDADLVVYLADFQPSVDKAIEQSGAKNVLNVADVVDLQKPAEEHGHDDHADEADHDHADEHADEEGHDHGDFDPHFWHDPQRMEAVVKAISDKLSSIDSADAAAFAANADGATAELKKLDGEFSVGLKECAIDDFITTHTAFNYLASRYNVTEIGISGVNPNDEPSPARIAEIQEEAKAHNVNTIFFETLTSPTIAKSIAGDLGLKTAVLDPLEGVTQDSPGTDYPSIMRANLEALRTANGCK